LAGRKVVIGCEIGWKKGRHWLFNWREGKSPLAVERGE
jgi:hypothetical protein